MINQELINYIKHSLRLGESKEKIYKNLLENEWTIEVIQENFNAIDIKNETKEEGKDLQKKTIRIVALTAAILVGAGIFSFIASNWQEMGKAVKVFIIIVSMLASYTAGWYFKEKKNILRVGEAFILLGSFIYGAGIFLIAQIFNIRANWPDGFILWMLGVIAVAFAADFFLLFYFSIILGIIASINYPILILVAAAGVDSYLLTSSFLLLIATIITFMVGINIRKKIPSKFKNFY